MSRLLTGALATLAILSCSGSSERTVYVGGPILTMDAENRIGSGVAMLVAGLTGMVLGGGCQTRDAQSRCVDPYGGTSLYPSMVVLGLGFTITGGYWYRTAATPPKRRAP